MYIVEVHKGCDFAPVSALAEMFHCSGQTVRRNLETINTNPRYKNAWITINDDGDKLINVLVYLDFLRYKPKLKYKNIAKNLPPFSEAEVRARRGDYQTIKEL